MQHKIVLFFLVMLFSISPLCFGKVKTQIEINVEACQSFERTDAKLNRVYQKILKSKKYAQDVEFIKNFKAAQQAWLTFRGAQLLALYPPHKENLHYYGSIQPVCECGYKEMLTQERIRQLEELWLDAHKEGDVCGWQSVKNKK